MKKTLLPLTVFITGASVLMIEVVAVRILSPYYGNTIFTVSSVISVILAALSLGYYAGGKLADRHPSVRWFFGTILLGGLCVLLLHALGTVALPVLGAALSLSTGPLVSSLLLFLLPALLLGTLSPYAIKLQSVWTPEQGVGTVTGKMFFWSTLGSIAGSLSTGFVFIPHFGIQAIVIGNGLGLVLLGALPLVFGLTTERISTSTLTFVLALAAATAWIIAQPSSTNLVYRRDGVYERISIYDGAYEGRPARFFQQDRSASGAMFLDTDDPTDLVYDYTKYYAAYQVFQPQVRRALVIGGGAYSIPKALLAELPQATVDVAEIEPSLFQLAHRYFRVPDDPRLHNFTEDGRRLLQDADAPYDLIFSDVYYSLLSIPAHFTTREFFMLAKERLAEDGVFMANIVGDLSRQHPSLMMAELKTFQSVFSNSYFFAVDAPGRTTSQNIVFIGYKSDRVVDFDDPALTEHSDLIIRSLGTKLIDTSRFELSPYPVLTDDFAPTEYLTTGALQRSRRSQPTWNGREMLALINQQLRYGPRYPTAPGHAATQNFLLAELRALTPRVISQRWQHDGADGQAYELTNIIGRFFPERQERIIIGTHYDSKRRADRDPHDPVQPVPGANDSASGAAVLIELARRLAQATTPPAVGVDLVFFDGEEGEEMQGGDYSTWQPLGSTYFAEHLTELNGERAPVGGIVLDMVCDRDLRMLREPSSMRYAPDQVEAFWRLAQGIDRSAFGNEIGPEIRDDHTPLNRAGIPSFLVIDFDYPYFHTAQDTADKCSADSLSAVARAVHRYLYSL